MENRNENFNGRFKLKQKVLDEISKRIEEKYGLKVIDIMETEFGYIFKGKYGFTIGDVTYNFGKEDYEVFNYHNGVKESIESRDKIVQERRKHPIRRSYRVQRNIAIGVAITMAGVVALTSLGVIKPLNKKQDDLNEVGIVTNVAKLNTIYSASDLILVEWSNYAIAGVRDYETEIEYLNTVKDDIYFNLFAPTMSTYYNYLDWLDSDLPDELIGTSIERTHADFRENALRFDEYLSTSPFREYTFDNSPFANALVVDSNGQNLKSSDGNNGELKDDSGKVVTYDDSYKLYVTAISVKGSDFSISNLPDDTIIRNGEAYVSVNHLFESLNNSKTK